MAYSCEAIERGLKGEITGILSSHSIRLFASECTHSQPVVDKPTYLFILSLMSELTHNVSTEKTHKAFMEICAAMASLQRAKTLLANYHYQSKKVDDYNWLLDNVGKYATPSDDAHEMLYCQLEAAKQTLRDSQSGELWASVKNDLSNAYKATDAAWETIK